MAQLLIELLGYLALVIVEALCEVVVYTTAQCMKLCSVWAWRTSRRQIQTYQEHKQERAKRSLQPKWSLLRSAGSPSPKELLRVAADAKQAEAENLLRAGQR